jgi:predicted NBD/HSP70 family sugar kinase
MTACLGTEDDAAGRSAAGSPPADLVVGLDIGGTKTLAVAVDRAGQARAEVRLATEATGGAGLVTSAAEALRRVAAAAGAEVGAIAAVGVGVPGIIDRRDGTVRHAVNLGVGADPVDLAGPLGQMIGGPVVVANDVNVAALGAAEAFETSADVAYLSIGTGVAVGFFLHGEMHVGARGIAGEIGHLPIDPDGALCECGQRGCLETVASGSTIARRWTAPDGGPGDAAGLFAAATAGDVRAVALRDEICGHLAAAVALVAHTVDPELIVLGGGVAEAGRPLLDGVRAALRARAVSPLIRSLDLPGRLTIVPEGVPVGALGAARAARHLLATRGVVS